MRSSDLKTAGPVFCSLGPVQLQSFCSLETGLQSTNPVSLRLSVNWKVQGEKVWDLYGVYSSWLAQYSGVRSQLEICDLIHKVKTSSVHVVFTACTVKPFLQLQGLCKYNFCVRNICGEPIYLHKSVGKRWILHKLHRKRQSRALAFLPMQGKPPRIFSLGKTIAVILFMEIKARKVVAGRGKECVSIRQAGIEQGWCNEGRSAAPLNCSIPGWHRQWRQEGNACAWLHWLVHSAQVPLKTILMSGPEFKFQHPPCSP